MEYHIRTMTIEDHPQVYDLWMSIHKFAMRSIDDSREGRGAFSEAESGHQRGGGGGRPDRGSDSLRS